MSAFGRTLSSISYRVVCSSSIFRFDSAVKSTWQPCILAWTVYSITADPLLELKVGEQKGREMFSCSVLLTLPAILLNALC